MRPVTKSQKITMDELSSMVIPHGSNLVIVHIPHKNKDTRTKSGIYVVGDMDYKPQDHAERWGFVYRVCDRLSYGVGVKNTMPWKTEVEISEGDKVWFDMREALYATTYDVDGEWYKVFRYEFLHVAIKPSGEVVPLNGYVLFEEYEHRPDSAILLSTNVDTRFAIARYIGEPNESYIIGLYSDDILIEEGDHVLFEAGTSCFPLESGLHNEFSEKRLVLQHRKRVIGVVDQEHKSVIRLHPNVIGVRVIERSKDVGSIIVLKDQKNFRYGIVEETTNEELVIGSVVVLPKQLGTAFGGLEYFTDDRVIYYEDFDS